MSNSQEKLEEVLMLANNSLAGQATAEEIERLEQLVLSDDEACRLYVDAMFDAQQLRRWAADDPWPTESLDVESLALPFDDNVANIEPFAENLQSEQQGPPSSLVNLFGRTIHGTTSFFSQEIPFALLIATVITGMGLLAGSFVYVSHHQPLASDSQQPTDWIVPSERKAFTSDMEFVGRITGMVDVKWSDNQTATVHGANVPLGRKYALASGLMEITYDTGARVVLQGPVTYEVDSRDGGFLSVGKLTARLEKRGEGREESSGKVASGQWLVASETSLPSPASGRGAGGEGSRQFQNVASEENPKSRNPEIPKSRNPEIPNPKSPAPRSQSLASMFAVRTPTVVVTDLGTEFGVEVGKNGLTKSFVFAGRIKVSAALSAGRTQGQEVILGINESILVERQNADDPKQSFHLHRNACKKSDFVRVEQMAAKLREAPKQPSEQFSRWKAFREQIRDRDDLLAYYDFQRDAHLTRDKNNCEILRNRAKSNTLYDGTLVGAISMGMAPGRMNGKHALRFDFASDGVLINLPNPLQSFTLAAWVNVKNHTQEWNGILLSNAYYDRPGSLHWQFMADGRIELAISGATHEKSMNWRSPPALLESGKSGGWHHMATVHDAASGKVFHFLDGQRLKTEPKSLLCKIPIVIGTASIGSWNCRDRALGGSIDELMIFNRAFSEEDINHLFRIQAPGDNDSNVHNK